MKKLIIISGPTGAGKTNIAIQLALFFQTEIISADSRQIYKGLEIGTAQPDADQLKLVPHHLISSHDITVNYNAGQFEKDALEILERIFNHKNIAIVCGGTGLYIDALLYSMDDLPFSDPALRTELNQLYRDNGLNYLQSQIEERDPDFAGASDMKNSQRLIRALEVCIISGLPYSSLKKGVKASRDFEFKYYAILPDRAELYNRINQRTLDMIEKGFVTEAQKMFPFRDQNALRTVGYKELFDFFDGKLSMEKTIELIQQHTRNYAKRQITWLNRNKDVIFLNPENAFDIIKEQNQA
ncbi:MAG: tRNA (adenosine(37)-N6)-dimethylallyltransferase MiaA [Bacteroidota bacterium]